MTSPAFGDIQRAPDGQLYQLTPGGWKPISADAAAAPQGVLPSAARSLGTMGLAGAYLASGGPGGLGDYLTGGGLSGGLRDAQAASDAGMASSPVATTIGSYLPDTALMAGPLAAGTSAAVSAGRRAVVGVADRMAGRVAQSIGAAGRQSADRVAASTLGGDSVGAAAANAPRGAADTAGQDFIGLMMGGEEMTADQSRLIPIGQRLGFEELPGMRGRADSPGRMLLSGAMSQPWVRAGIQDTLEHNAAVVERTALKAMGTPGPRKFGTEAFRAAKESTATTFDAVRDSLPQRMQLPADLVAGLEETRGVAPELKYILGPDGAISRDDLFALRSDLNTLASDLSTAPGKRLIGNRIGDLSSQLDGFIKTSLSPEMRTAWNRARVQYMVQKLLERPGVMQPDGSISWRSARTVLNREMPDAFRQTLEGARDNLTPEVRDFMDAIDYASAFGDLVPNSGTATRIAATSMNVRDNAKALALRYYLRRERDMINAGKYAEEAANGP